MNKQIKSRWWFIKMIASLAKLKGMLCKKMLTSSLNNWKESSRLNTKNLVFENVY